MHIDHSSRIKFGLMSSGSLVIQCNMTNDISFMIQIEKDTYPLRLKVYKKSKRDGINNSRNIHPIIQWPIYIYILNKWVFFTKVNNIPENLETSCKSAANHQKLLYTEKTNKTYILCYVQPHFLYNQRENRHYKVSKLQEYYPVDPSSCIRLHSLYFFDICL